MHTYMHETGDETYSQGIYSIDPLPPTPYPLNGRLTPEGYRARRLA